MSFIGKLVEKKKVIGKLLGQKEIVHPVVMPKAYRVEWCGYQGKSSWGTLFLMKWAIDHPDTHCEDHTYTPDENGVCSCGWIPADAVFGKKKISTRLVVEKKLLCDMVSESSIGPNLFLYAGYLGYIAAFKDQLSGTPDLSAVMDWFNKLPGEEKERLIVIAMPDVPADFMLEYSLYRMCPK